MAVVGILLPSALDEFVSLARTFIFEEYSKQGGVEEKKKMMEGLLLLFHSVIEEAEARHIENQSLLKYLDYLKGELAEANTVYEEFTNRNHALESSGRHAAAYGIKVVECICYIVKRVFLCDNKAKKMTCSVEKLQKVAREHLGTFVAVLDLHDKGSRSNTKDFDIDGEEKSGEEGITGWLLVTGGTLMEVEVDDDDYIIVGTLRVPLKESRAQLQKSRLNTSPSIPNVKHEDIQVQNRKAPFSLGNSPDFAEGRRKSSNPR